MHKTFIIITAIISLTFFNTQSFSSLGSNRNVLYQPLNSKVLSYVQGRIGQRVGRGECVDLVINPLLKNNAVWDMRLNYGQRIATGDSSGHFTLEGFQVEPGDIIKFNNVRLQEIRITEDLYLSKYHRLGYPLHVAVVEKVASRYMLQILHQNVYKKKYVIRESIYLAALNKGYYLIYRPYSLKK